jgi:DNA-binding GntR family transcriptional regulator
MLLAKKPTKLGPFWDEHAAILSAVVSGDKAAAGQLAQSHALSSAKVISNRTQVKEPAVARD